MEDHKPLWCITVHLSSLISLILADGKLILLCDRLNPINSVCPIITSPLTHTPGFPGYFDRGPLSKRLEGGTLGFKSRRKIKRIDKLVAAHFSCVANYIFKAQLQRDFLNHLDIFIRQSWHLSPSDSMTKKMSFLMLSRSPSSSRLVFQVSTVPLSSSDLQRDKISLPSQRKGPEAPPNSFTTPSGKKT